jgi:hypothetical protein
MKKESCGGTEERREGRKKERKKECWKINQKY